MKIKLSTHYNRFIDEFITNNYLKLKQNIKILKRNEKLMERQVYNWDNASKWIQRQMEYTYQITAIEMTHRYTEVLFFLMGNTKTKYKLLPI